MYVEMLIAFARCRDEKKKEIWIRCGGGIRLVGGCRQTEEWSVVVIHFLIALSS